MQWIDKRATNEPAAWVRYRHTPGVSYTPSDDVRRALAEEQGYICAFCTRHLALDGKKINKRSPTKIAHLEVRNPPPPLTAAEVEYRHQRGLAYDNMVLTCDGYSSGDIIHCDVQQDDQDVTLPLFNQQLMATFAFTPDGGIRHDNPVYQAQLGDSDQRPGVLNLNATTIKKQRKQELARALAQIATRSRRAAGTWRRSDIQSELNGWLARQADDQYLAHRQFVIYHLTKKLRRAT